MEFVKMHGTGNDFILIEDFEEKLFNKESELAKRLCHRRFGIGADGLVLIRKSRIAKVKMDIINSDGSKANMCGNAIRCFAKYVYEQNRINDTKFSVETGDGVKEIEVYIDSSNKVISVKVDMGQAFFQGDKIPLLNKESLINENIMANKKEYKVTSLLVGVPHTIVLVKDDEYTIEEGKYIEKAPIFKEGTNVNFVKVINEKTIEVNTWERGAGATYSCGTGCSASVAVTNMLKLTQKEVDVKVPGGMLKITLEEDKIFMFGPAEVICKGVAY